MTTHWFRTLSLWLSINWIMSIDADDQFKSRPDLSPPKLNITIPATNDVDNGYIFMCPYSGFKKGNGFDGPEQPACYIFRDTGDLVWSSLGYLSGWVANMQVRSWKGQPVITAFQGQLDSFHGHGFGQPVILSQRYETIANLHGGNHKIISIHEFNLLESGSALVEIYEPLQMDLSPYDDTGVSSWIVNAIVQEIDVETGNLLFEWSSLDHVRPSESAISLKSGHAGSGLNSTDAWDYFHINSVDKDDDGNYLISARHASTIYKINGMTGEIIWQLGGRGSHFTYPKEAVFGFQHDARFLRGLPTNHGVEHISLFDNAARAKGHRGGGIEVIHDRSRAKVLCLDTNNWTASVVWALASPDEMQAPSQGNVQTLPNSNLLVGWGQGGAMTEYRARDGEPIFHSYLDSGEVGDGVQSYRVFRYPWKGYPREAPAIVSLVGEDHDGRNQTTIFVSWNGDTETSTWRFYSTSRHCAWLPRNLLCGQKLLGEGTRTSFETQFTVNDASVSSGLVNIFAEAIDAAGNILVRTEPICSEMGHPTVAMNEEQVEWQKFMVQDELK